MEFSFPIESEDGYKYLIELTEQTLNFLGVPFNYDVRIYNITLSLIEKGSLTVNPVLSRIGYILSDFLDENGNVILYFYCSPTDHDIEIRPNRIITPQEFRSKLFLNIYKRLSYKFKKEYFHISYTINSPDGKLFNHFITHRKNKNIIEELEVLIHDK